MDEKVRAADVGAHWSLRTSFTSRVVLIFKLYTMKIFSAFVREAAVDWSRIIINTKVRLAFMRSGYQMGGYILTIQDVVLDNGFIRGPIEHIRRVQRVFATNRFDSSLVKKNSFVPVWGGREEGRGLWNAEILPLFRIGVRGSNESQEYAFSQSIVMTRSIDKVGKTLRCVCLRCISDDEVPHSLRRSIRTSERGAPSVREWIGMACLEIVIGCVDVVRPNYSIAPLTRRILWPLRRFYLNRLHTDF